MMQESRTQETVAAPPGVLIPDAGELSEAELAFVVGGGEGPPGGPGDNNGVLDIASPILM